MNELHIHEILHMMVDNQKTYMGEADFVKDIEEKYGADTRFYACSGTNMNAQEAFYFLLQRNKISLNTQQSVAIDPNMTMCDD